MTDTQREPTTAVGRIETTASVKKGGPGNSSRRTRSSSVAIAIGGSPSASRPAASV